MDLSQLPPGMAGYIAAQQANQQQGMQQLAQAQGLMGILNQQQQMEEAAKKRALVERARGILSTTPDGALNGQQKAILVEAGMLPATALFKPTEPVKLGAGDVLLDPTTKQPVYQAPFKPESDKESPLAKLIRERDALPQGHPNRALFDSAITAASTKAPLVNVDNRQPTKFNEKVGTELGEQYAGLMKADFSAPATIGKYERLGSLLSQVGTGKFTGSTIDLKAAAKGAGIDLAALGIADNVAPAQAAKALSNQLALELRNPAGGAGMPGALSDQDRKFLLEMIPSLESDPQAWPKMIEYRVALAKREQQVAKMARAYRKKNGEFDEGFFDELQDWSNKNPLFPSGAPKVPALSTKAQGYLDAAGVK